jgi:hypothetical protein
VPRFAACIRQLYPGCPPDRAQQIASHACQKHSGRVGRSAAAKRLDEQAVQLAVVAHVRHEETRYDELVARGVERWDARDRVREDVDRVLSRWRQMTTLLPGRKNHGSRNEKEREQASQAGGRHASAPDQDDD